MENNHDIEADEWPPFQTKTFVNLALLECTGFRTEQEYNETFKRHKEGTCAVDKLAHHSKVTKDITQIFAADSMNPTATEGTSSKGLKFILIEGAPGVGKTVLAKRIASL